MYYVFSDSHNVYITLEEGRTDEFQNFLGEFKVFTHAKKLAMEAIDTKVANYRQDYSEAKFNKAMLSGLTKKKVISNK